MEIKQIIHIEKGIVFGLGNDNKLYYWNSKNTAFELFTFEIAIIIDEAFREVAKSFQQS